MTRTERWNLFRKLDELLDRREQFEAIRPLANALSRLAGREPLPTETADTLISAFAEFIAEASGETVRNLSALRWDGSAQGQRQALARHLRIWRSVMPGRELRDNFAHQRTISYSDIRDALLALDHGEQPKMFTRFWRSGWSDHRFTEAKHWRTAVFYNAYRKAVLGNAKSSDWEVASAFGVSTRTLGLWKNKCREIWGAVEINWELEDIKKRQLTKPDNVIFELSDGYFWGGAPDHDGTSLAEVGADYKQFKAANPPKPRSGSRKSAPVTLS